MPSLPAWIFFCTAVASSAIGSPDPDEILRMSRVNHINQSAKLDAQLRNSGGRAPFVITLDGGVVSYAFSDPDQEIQLHLDEEGSQLKERVGGKSSEIKPARFDQRVRGTPITFEDLAMQFLYWPRPKLIGEDRIRGRSAWKLEIQAPRGGSQYGVARLWIDKESGALLRIEGYNLEGKRIKQFEMVSVQKIEGQWMLKQMRVEALDPETGKVRERTYLEVLGHAD